MSPPCHPPPTPRRRRRSSGVLVGRAESRPPLHDTARQGRGTAHVHHRQAQRRRQVVGDPGRDRATEEDRVSVGRHLLTEAVPAREAVLDHQGREGQRDQGRDAVADGEAEGRLRTDLLDGADEHPARAGHRVLHLAAGGDDLEHLTAYGVTVGPTIGEMGGLELPERRRIEVEGLDPHPHLVGPELAPGVEALGRLGQGDRIVEDPVQPGRVARPPDFGIGAERRHVGVSSVGIAITRENLRPGIGLAACSPPTLT
jgi:hypothetical protein